VQPGWVWRTDTPDSPCTVVLTRFGFMQWLGPADDLRCVEAFEQQLQQWDPALPGYLLWYDPPPRWQAWLAARPGVRQRERVQWAFQSLPRHAAAATPNGFRQRSLNATLARQAEPLGLNLGARFWPSMDALLSQGLGQCLVDAQDRVVACAYAACVAGGVAEVDIAVAPEQRGLGLGLAVGRAFIEGCLHQGVRPGWDCFAANEASMRLASLLGFSPVRRYAMVSFNVPLKGIATPAVPDPAESFP
jgi:GNAT superfamily N-acetyltransferase